MPGRDCAASLRCEKVGDDLGLSWVLAPDAQCCERLRIVDKTTGSILARLADERERCARRM